MPPKKNAKKKELTAEDMRRMGMSEEDLQRILAERGKSSEDKKADQKQEEERRREAESRQRAAKELLQHFANLVSGETEPRVRIMDEEEAAWVAMEPDLTAEKNRRLRAFLEKEMSRKAGEAKLRREAEAAAYEASLRTLTDEERAKLLAEQMEAEKQSAAAAITAEEKRLRAQRREERRQARLAQKDKGVEEYYESESDDEGTKKKKPGNTMLVRNGIDEVKMEMLEERYL